MLVSGLHTSILSIVLGFIIRLASLHVIPPYTCLYHRQPVDHFNYDLNHTFLQRYLVVDEFWNSDGGPIFVYTGNEGDIIWFYNSTGQILEWAFEFEALVVFAEHRYYGESLPYGSSSFQDLNHLGFLNSAQALADFANLIAYIKQTVIGASNSPVVAFGGSYGGMLAAWLRMKYPHVVSGALASSAPIWSFTGIVPCGLFNEIVTRSFESSSSTCVSSIRKSWKIISILGETDKGRVILTQSLGLCNYLRSWEDIMKLKSWLSETWSNLAMVNYPYAADFLEPLPAWPVKIVCSMLSTENLSDVELLQRLRKAISVYYNFTGDVPCFNTSSTAVASLQEKGWDFQQCTEMVMPVCSDGVNDMFEKQNWNISEYTDYCKKIWNVTPRVNWIVEQYGGKDLISASNIIFSNGDLDPWSAGGVLTSISESLEAIVIKDAAHHLDLRSSHSGDIYSVIVARKREKAIIRSWINQHWLAVASVVKKKGYNMDITI